MSNDGPIGAPVPPPKRRRGRWLITIAAIAALFALLMIPVLIVLALAFGDLGETTRFEPTTVEEIPTSYSDDVDRVELDLSRLDADDFADQTVPLGVDLDIDLGSILVIMPDDLTFSIDSNVDLGSIIVFGEEVDGVDIEFGTTRASGDDAVVDLELLLDVDVGQIDVERP